MTNIMLRGGGAVHAVRIFVPNVATKTSSGTMPVVINWAPVGLTGTQQAMITDYDPLAQAQGFVVAYPTGVPSKESSLDSWQLVNSYDPQRNDIAFANTLIDTLIAHWCVNPVASIRLGTPMVRSSQLGSYANSQIASQQQSWSRVSTIQRGASPLDLYRCSPTTGQRTPRSRMAGAASRYLLDLDGRASKDSSMM